MNKAELEMATASMTKSLIEFGEFKEASIVLEAAQKYVELLPHLEALKGEEGELLPCPFCGGEAKLQPSDGGHFVFCISCNSEGTFVKEHNCDYRGGSKDEAIKAWNTRPTLSAIVKILAGTHEVEG